MVTTGLQLEEGLTPPPFIFFQRKINQDQVFTPNSAVGGLHINSVFLYKIFPMVLFFSFSKENGPKTNQHFISKGRYLKLQKGIPILLEYSLLLAAPRDTDGIDNKFMVGIFQTHYSYKIKLFKQCS